MFPYHTTSMLIACLMPVMMQICLCEPPSHACIDHGALKESFQTSKPRCGMLFRVSPFAGRQYHVPTHSHACANTGCISNGLMQQTRELHHIAVVAGLLGSMAISSAPAPLLQLIWMHDNIWLILCTIWRTPVTDSNFVCLERPAHTRHAWLQSISSSSWCACSDQCSR